MTTEELILVEDLETLSLVKSYLDNPDNEYVAFDTETTGLSKDSEIVGYSIACEEHIGIYVVLAHWVPALVNNGTCLKCEGTGETGKKKKKSCTKCEGKGHLEQLGGELVYNHELKEASHEVMQMLQSKKLIMHNSPFDCDVIQREFKINLMPSVHTDTMELWHVLDENESIGLKEIGSRLFGTDAKEEAANMKESVIANGGAWSGKSKEMFKASKDLLARYGAKDTILTLKIFYEGVPRLYEEELDKFFYDEESMPLMRSATYDMNTVGIKVDVEKLKAPEFQLTDLCTRLKREIEDLCEPYTKCEDWPFETKTFNVTSNQQIAWALFIKEKHVFNSLTKTGKIHAKRLLGKLPYKHKDKREFIKVMQDQGLKPYAVLQCDSETLSAFKDRHLWVKKLAELKDASKTLSTYVKGILTRVRCGIINPSFLQAGTSSGRYSSRQPNFQNLPKKDKRIKSCIISRPGKSFVGADYSQLEPRVFASVSQDPILMDCFATGDDFYSVVGAPIFGKTDCSTLKKIESDPNCFANKYKNLREIAKQFALATPYGTSAFQQSRKLKMESDEAQEIIDAYFEQYPAVKQMQLDSHEQAKRDGVVYSLYGRPRRIPLAKKIPKLFGKAEHHELEYEWRNLLNLAMNHRVQSSAASIVNRAMIAFSEKMLALGIDAKIVLQVHDEIVVECKDEDVEIVMRELQNVMENTTTLPGVALIAEPKAAKVLAELK